MGHNHYDEHRLPNTDAESERNPLSLALVPAVDRSFRRHHNVARGWLGADQPQHDDRDNRMVPGE
jgi:hypothetical protein